MVVSHGPHLLPVRRKRREARHNQIRVDCVDRAMTVDYTAGAGNFSGGAGNGGSSLDTKKRGRNRKKLYILIDFSGAWKSTFYACVIIKKRNNDFNYIRTQG